MYSIKPEFVPQWFPYDDPTPVSMDEIKRLSAEWEIPVDELINEMEEI